MNARPRAAWVRRAGAALALAAVLVLGLSAPAVAAGTPNGTSATAAGCAPYFPANNLAEGGFFCVVGATAGMTFPHPGYCTNAGFAARNTAGVGGKPVYSCVSFGDAVKGDLFGGWQDQGQTLAAQQMCAANNMTFAKKVTVDTGEYVVCDGTPSKTVSDASAQAKLDTLAAKVDAVTAATVANKPAAAGATGPASVVLDGSQWGLLLPLLFGALSLLLLLGAIRTVRSLIP